MKRALLTACVMALSGCLAMPVLARGRGGSHGGGRGGGHAGGHVAVQHGGHVGHGGYAGHGYDGHGGFGGHGYYGRGYGYGGYGGFFGGYWPFLGWGWGYPYYGGYDNAPYVIDNSGPYVNGPVDYGPGYSAPLPQTPMPVPTAAPATLEVIVPNPQAQLWVGDTQTTTTGTDRVFQTPPLALGSTYAYHLRAVWMDGLMPTIVDRQVQVTPGSRTVIDLGKPTPTNSPSNVIAN